MVKSVPRPSQNRQAYFAEIGRLGLRTVAPPTLTFEEGGPYAGQKDETGIIGMVVGSAECASNIHCYRGFAKEKPGRLVPGHEPLVEIVEKGSGVHNFEVGDWVLFGFNHCCMSCRNCKRGLTNLCLVTNPGNSGAAFGYPNAGPVPGAHQQLMHIPFASGQGIKLDKEKLVSKGKILDALCLADIGPTAYHAAVMAGVRPGSRVMIAGMGPVGLAAVLAAWVQGARRFVVTDKYEVRLEQARKVAKRLNIQMLTINIAEHNGVEIAKLVEDFMGAPNAFIDCVGVEACGLGGSGSSKLAAATVLNQAIELAEPGSALGVIGAYFQAAPASEEAGVKKGIYAINFGLAWDKALWIHTGQTPVLRYLENLLEMVMMDEYPIAEIVNAKFYPLEDVDNVWKRFGSGESEKPIIDPNGIIALNMAAV